MSSVNMSATVAAMMACQTQIAFGACKLLTNENIVVDDRETERVAIPALTSSAAYSNFLLSDLVDYVDTSFCLVVQWDGHVLDARRWQSEFLDYDYIGASWPQFSDGWDVGNGGFSLRSRRLLEACRAPGFVQEHPEDVAICRSNRTWLEGQGLRFAPRSLANLFSAERAGDPMATFGFHGAWLMPRAVGAEQFWKLYQDLDEVGSVAHDRWPIIAQILRGPDGVRRACRMVLDLVGTERRGRGNSTSMGLQNK